MSDLNATYASHRGREEDGHTDIIGSKKAREMKKVSQRRPSEITSELLDRKRRLVCAARAPSCSAIHFRHQSGAARRAMLHE